MSGSLYGVFDDQGLMGNYDFSTPVGTTSAEQSDSGSSGSSVFSQLWQGITQAAPAAIAAIKTDAGGLLGRAVTAAKTSILGDTAASLARNKAVQAGAKQTAANKIGSWILDNWQILAIGGLAIVGALIFARGKE